MIAHAPVLGDVVIRPADIARFRAKVDRDSDPWGCWMWTGALMKCTNGGYGVFYLGGGKRTVLAHRVAYAIAFGGVPLGLVIRHGPSCQDKGFEGRRCCNPAHLAPGTHAENLADSNRNIHGWFRYPSSGIPMTDEERALFEDVFENLTGISVQEAEGDPPSSAPDTGQA